MNYLFIDASENHTIAQIGSAAACLTERFDTNRNLAALISEICEQMLKKGDLTRQQLDLFAVCTGPGSLTGLRVAAAFFRTLAMLKSKPLVGIDIFTWSLQTLLDQGYRGKVKLVLPTLIDKAFAVEATLPDLSFAKPRLIDKATIVKSADTFAIKGQIAGLAPLYPDEKSLHSLITNFDTTKEFTFNDILEVLPMYVIPSQAERKFEEKQ